MNNFLKMITVLFIGLKLTNIIDWSWWLVLLPLYGGITLIGVFMIVAAIALFFNDENKPV